MDANGTRIQRLPSASTAIRHRRTRVSGPTGTGNSGLPPLHYGVPGHDLLGDTVPRLELCSVKVPGLLQVQPEFRQRPEIPGCRSAMSTLTPCWPLRIIVTRLTGTPSTFDSRETFQSWELCAAATPTLRNATGRACACSETRSRGRWSCRSVPL